MSRKIANVFLLVLFMLAACGSPASNDILATPTSEWRIVFIHSGGFVGLMRTLEVSSDGSYFLKDDRTGFTKSGRLPVDELADLGKTLKKTDYVPQTAPTGCADCFIYNIEVISGGDKFSAQVDDVNIDASGLRPLISVLRGILERELQSQ